MSKEDFSEYAEKTNKWLSGGVSGNRWAVVAIVVVAFILGAIIF